MQNITQLTELTEQEIANIEGEGAGDTLIGITVGIGVIAGLLGAPLTALFFGGAAVGEGVVYLTGQLGQLQPAPNHPSGNGLYYYYYYSDPMWC